jgi:hypothetical protein
MPLLQVGDLPDDIYEEITYEARRQNRTIAQQIIALIKKGLREEVSNRERRHLAIERTFARDIPLSAKSMDYVKLIREDRGR